VTLIVVNQLLPASGRYYFAVKAYNGLGESEYTTEMVFTDYVAGGSATSAAMTSSTASTSVTAPYTPYTEGGVIGEGNVEEAADPEAPGRPRIEILDRQDLWIRNPVDDHWRQEFGLIWKQQEDKQTLVHRDWIFTPHANQELPGPQVSADDLETVRNGTHYWMKTVYVPEPGAPFAEVSYPSGPGFVRSTMLVWFHHILVDENQIKIMPVAAMSLLENNQGYALFTRGAQGEWVSDVLSNQATFTMFIPNFSNWISPYDINDPREGGRRLRPGGQ
jgi:hypothetical protein